VAPALDAGATTVAVYLPIGSWVDAWTGKVTTATTATGGVHITKEAPIGQPPIFYTAGSKDGDAVQVAPAGLDQNSADPDCVI